MKFSAQFLDEIRARVPISQVVGRAVQWDRRKSNPGRGDYWACCPFHSEKTPSFHADDRKGYYYCFGCHAKGDHFSFLTEKMGMSFAEAVEQLAAEAGLPMPKPDPKAAERESARTSLAEVMEMAAGFFEEQLKGPQGRKAREYIAARGLSASAVARFRLGCAPDARDGLLRHLQERGVSRQLMVDAGLIGVPEDGRSAYDRFRDRLMFPIRDVRGRVIAFGGRALGEARAKYLNSPETELFHKSRVLYNLDLARGPAHEGGSIIAVEGYMDVIALDGAGFANVVAPLGTALTQAHLEQLWRMAAEPVLCFDGDAAGMKAAWRTLEMALEHLRPGHSLRFAMLPEGMDPDDLVRESGAAAFAAVLDGALPLMEMLWRHMTANMKTATPEEKARLEVALEEMAGRIAEPRVRQHYLSEIRARLRELWRAPTLGARPRSRRMGAGARRARGGRGGSGAGRRHSDASPHLLSASRALEGAQLHEREILKIVLLQPVLLEDVAEDLAELPFSSPELDSLRRKILDTAAAHADLDSMRLLAHLREEGAQRAVERLLGASMESRRRNLPDLDLDHAREAFHERMARMRRTADLNRDLEAAEKAFAVDPTEENFARINRIREELHALAGGAGGG